MKVECRYCGKILDEKDVFMDTDQNGRFYFFCDQEHRDKFGDIMQEHVDAINLMSHPLYGIIFMGAWIRDKFKKSKKE